ncbi:hypothetical protein R5R73_04960 [Salinicola sp. LHM]|uniref:hypothetical protein n=1 Tax=Salinicola sp. LHM TaxID=3065298 RepID=UPI002ACEEB9B|nr:hypothetical protein [Salinicola sp. LHM]WQH34039.1 hypothetical protein R5R73_04960 [Salinicola sp. LHM]
MSLTDAQWQRWLSSPNAVRVTVAELEHADGVEQVSDRGYLAPASERLARPRYAGLLIEAVGIETRIDGAITFGDIRLIDDGEITHWRDYRWDGHPVRLYLGAPDWPRGDFRQIASAINDGIQSAERGEIVLGVVDASSVLEQPIDTGQLPYDGGPVPLLLGQCYNVPAFRDESTTLHYRISYLPLLGVTPRQLGYEEPYTPDLDNGGFTLSNNPGTSSDITAGGHEQHDTPAAMIQWIADHYGLTVGTVDLPDVTVGYYSNGETSGRDILDRLCEGLGAHWYLDALGRLTARVLREPSATPDVTLTRDDIVDGTLALDRTEAPWPKLTFRWQRNDATLRTVAGDIMVNAPETEARLQRDWNESVAEQALTGYPRAEPVTRESLLQIAAEAAAERDRLLALYAERRDVYRVDSYRIDLQLHQTITINEPPLLGRVGRIIAVNRSTAEGLAQLEIWL